VSTGRRRAHTGERRDPESLLSLLQRRSAASRQRIIIGAAIGAALLGAVSIALAWRQYDDAKSRSLTDLEARVVAVSAVIDTSFRGQITALNSIAAAPSVVGERTPRMRSYFRRVNPPHGGLFSGGLGWIDRSGRLRVSSTGGSARLNLASRAYFQRVIRSGTPYVSAGLVGRRLRQPVVVVAVATRDSRGRISGVLAGSIVLKSVAESKRALDLGYGNLQIVDRMGHLLLAGLAPARNTELVHRMTHRTSGVLSNTAGLGGSGGHVVAYATSPVSGWTSVIDRPRSSVFAAALRALLLELVSVGAALLLVVSILIVIARRSRRDSQIEQERARSWSDLTRALAAAATPAAIEQALRAALSSSFPKSTTFVEIAAEASDSEHVRDGLRPKEANEADRPERGAHRFPMLGANGESLGSIAVFTTGAELDPVSLAALESFAAQGAQAIERTRLYVHEHNLATRLQKSLLPDILPSGPGLVLTGRYSAGGESIEVGGDWYDALRRPDGIVQICVGDVSGRGIDAAIEMGRYRSLFQVYARDHASPAEIVKQMLRHDPGQGMVTLACVSVDPCTTELTYTCAGHPPPLLVDKEAGTLIKLDRASSPPIGVVEASEIVEARLSVPDQAVLAVYTDGLIERRGLAITEGIDLLGRLLLGDDRAPDSLVARIGQAIGASDDDAALLLVELELRRAAVELEYPADPASLPRVRRRLRGWLAAQQVGPNDVADIVLAVSEACNNAIEHAYRDRPGTLTVKLNADPLALEAVVEDRGRWQPPASTDEGGRGIWLMRHLMDTVRFEANGHGTTVSLRRRRERTERSPAQPESRASAPRA